MKKGDFAVFAVIVLLALLPCLFVLGGGKAAQAQVRVDGVTVQRFSLLVNAEYPIRSPYGINLIKVHDGRVCIREADCAGHECEAQGWISRSGETLVCLPHKLTVTLLGEEGSGYDAVTQ